MVQTIYGLLAIGMVMVLSLNLFRVMTSTHQKMVLNEVATQVTGVAVDLMEHVGNQAFDEETHEGKVVPQPPVFPLVTSPGLLTPEAGFGGCADFYDTNCDDVDDFDGMTIERVVEGIPYTAEITVRYVSEANPNTAAGTQTYAKEVAIEITSPYLRLGLDPFPPVRISRVFSYKRITS